MLHKGDHFKSLGMYQQLNQFKLPIWKKSNGQSYISIKSSKSGPSKEYEIVDGFSHICDQPMISMGQNIQTREWIVFDPKEEKMQARYRELKNSLLKQYKNDAKQTIQGLLKQIISFIRGPKGFNYCEKVDLKRKIEKEIQTYPKNPVFNIPIIPLEFFLEKGGVCRHHGLLLVFFLNKLIQDGILPLGRAYHHRDNIDLGGHVWAIYQPSQSSHYYLIDSLWGCAFQLPQDELAVRKHYGNHAVEECIKRYSKKITTQAAPAKVHDFFKNAKDTNETFMKELKMKKKEADSMGDSVSNEAKKCEIYVNLYRSAHNAAVKNSASNNALKNFKTDIEGALSEKMMALLVKERSKLAKVIQALELIGEMKNKPMKKLSWR